MKVDPAEEEKELLRSEDHRPDTQPQQPQQHQRQETQHSVLDDQNERGNASFTSMRQRGQPAAPEAPQAAQPQQGSEEAMAQPPPKKAQHSANNMCIRCVRSPAFRYFTFGVVAVTPIFGCVFALPTILNTICTGFLCRLCNYFLAWWVLIQFLYNFGMTQWTDAGSCKEIKPTYEPTGQFELDLGPSENDSTQKMYYAPNWCDHCQHWKPPRAHHCSVCRRCVLRMDHHCPFTGNCIGFRNQGHFVLMYSFGIVGLLYSSVLCVSAIMLLKGDTTIWNGSLMKNLPFFTAGLASFGASVMLQTVVIAGPAIAVQALLTVIAFVAVLSCGIPQIWCASSGTTIIEQQFPMKEYVQIKPQVYCPLGPGFYRQSCKRNLLDIMGSMWWLRLLLPTTGGPIDLRPAFAPTPSKLGADALRSRLTQVEEEGIKHEVSSCHELGINPGPTRPSGALV